MQTIDLFCRLDMRMCCPLGLIQIKTVVVLKITVLPFILHVHGTFMLLRLSLIKGTHAQTFKRSAKLHQVVMLHGASNNTVLPGDCKRANLMEKALLEELLLSCIEPKTGRHPGKVHRPNDDTLLHNPGLITVTPELV